MMLYGCSFICDRWDYPIWILQLQIEVYKYAHEGAVVSYSTRAHVQCPSPMRRVDSSAGGNLWIFRGYWWRTKVHILRFSQEKKEFLKNFTCKPLEASDLNGLKETEEREREKEGEGEGGGRSVCVCVCVSLFI